MLISFGRIANYIVVILCTCRTLLQHDIAAGRKAVCRIRTAVLEHSCRDSVMYYGTMEHHADQAKKRMKSVWVRHAQPLQNPQA